MKFEYEKLVKSRKEYNCTYCGEKILKATMYFNINITPWCHPDNESYENWKVHDACKDLGDKFYWDNDNKGVFADECYQSDFVAFKQKELFQ